MIRIGIFAITTALLLGSTIACVQTDLHDPRPMAEDPVCAYHGDLGCIRVRIDENTPYATYGGKTYYFCSEDCRKTFEENPAKYLPDQDDDSTH